MGAGSSIFGSEERRWGSFDLSAPKNEDEGGFFDLPTSRIEGGGFFVLRSRKIENTPSSKNSPIFEKLEKTLPLRRTAPSSKNPLLRRILVHLRRIPPSSNNPRPSSKNLQLSIFGAENRRTPNLLPSETKNEDISTFNLRPSTPKIEEPSNS